MYFTALACCVHQDSSTVWWHAIAGFLLSSIMDLQCLTENLNNQSKLWTEIAMHNRKLVSLVFCKDGKSYLELEAIAF